MLNINPGARLNRELKIPLYHGYFRHAVRTAISVELAGLPVIDSVLINISRVLLMKADRKLELRDLLHRSSYYRRISKRDAVVRESDGTGICESFHICELFAFHAAGDICTRFHMNPGLLSFLKTIGQGIDRINRRLCICHHNDRSETAFGRRCRTCQDILLLCEAGITKVDMNINETGGDHTALCIDDVRFTRRLRLIALSDRTSLIVCAILSGLINVSVR